MYALLTAHTSGTRSRRRFYSIAAPSGMLRTSWATTGSSPPNFYLGQTSGRRRRHMEIFWIMSGASEHEERQGGPLPTMQE
jgi:hypothetical protein